jgi:acetyl esterase/lipase
VAVAVSVLAGCGGVSPSGARRPSSHRAASTPSTSPRRYLGPVFAALTTVVNIQYGSAPRLDKKPERLLLDLHEPTGDSAMRRPAIVFVHGGGYATGDKEQGPSAIMAHLFARLGYVTVSIDYRLLAPTGCIGFGGGTSACREAALAAIADAQAAVRWLRAHHAEYRIDPSRIAIEGDSAGAITATGVGMLATMPGHSGNPSQSSRVGAWVSLSGGVPKGIFVKKGVSPGILFSGTADAVVPHQWSVDTANAMRKVGVPVQLVTFKGAGHIPWQYRNVIESRAILFLYTYLHLAGADR